MTYQPIAPAAVLPADGRASKLRVYNPSYSGAAGSPLFADFDFSANLFSLNLNNGGTFNIVSRTRIFDFDNDAGEIYDNRAKSLFGWLSLYQAKAVAEAQVLVDDEKARAEGVESNLQTFIDDEKGRAEGVEATLQTGIDSANTAIANILNGSPEHLNQLTEIVADYTANGATVTTALQAEVDYARAEAADLRARVAALETLVASLVNST